MGNLYTGDPGRRLTEQQVTNLITAVKGIMPGHLTIVMMLPIDKEMREFGAALRYAAQQGGWTQDGVMMDTNTERYSINFGGGNLLTNAPQGTHCVVTKTTAADHRAQDFRRALEAEGVKCESGGHGYYPELPKATLAIYIGVDSQ